MADDAIKELAALVRQSTIVFRKGDVITVEEKGDLRVISIDNFPPIPSHGEWIDCHFVGVGFTEMAADKEQFAGILSKALDSPGCYGPMPAETLEGGPSYINVGGWIGDQTLAFQLMALMEHYGMGEVVTPAKLHITGEQADQLAGGGMIYIAKFKREMVDV